MQYLAHLSSADRTPYDSYIADPVTRLVHRDGCPKQPQYGVNVVDVHAATTQGYGTCACLTNQLVAPAERIRNLLATTFRLR